MAPTVLLVFQCVKRSKPGDVSEYPIGDCRIMPTSVLSAARVPSNLGLVKNHPKKNVEVSKIAANQTKKGL